MESPIQSHWHNNLIFTSSTQNIPALFDIDNFFGTISAPQYAFNFHLIVFSLLQEVADVQPL
jgi:hypothetical protein